MVERRVLSPDPRTLRSDALPVGGNAGGGRAGSARDRFPRHQSGLGLFVRAAVGGVAPSRGGPRHAAANGDL